MKRIIGYQIVKRDGLEIPDGFFSFQVFSQSFVNDWLLLNDIEEKTWKSIPVFEGDVEEPAFIGYEYC
jgi:hypothetical protein